MVLETEKVALEMLFNAGVLMVTYRENFQRYYDLTENVLPSGIYAIQWGKGCEIW